MNCSTWLVLFVLFVATSLLCEAAGPNSQPPNIVFVLADDLGWAELECYGNGFNETPHLNALAKEGMRFIQAYAAAPVCSPYRAALLTGQHPARVGIIDYLRPNSANALSTQHRTLAEMLQQNGYATGMIGKWHLTGYLHHDAEHEVRPTDHGFEWNFASEVKGVGNGANFWPYVFRTQPIRWVDIPTNRLGDNEYLTDRMNVEAVDFIERNKDRPFFLYLSHYAPHTILNGRPDLVEKYRNKHRPGDSTRARCYLCEDAGHEGDPLHHWASDHNPHLAAMLESIDDGIGLITAKLHQLGIAENTIVVFTSDNGGETNVTSNGPLRGGKSQLYEGGIRVPQIIRWPEQIPPGTVSNRPTANVDFYPTLLHAAGIDRDPQQTLDGFSMLQSWCDPDRPSEREALYWHYPLDRPHFLGGESSGAIRVGDWKLIEFFDSGRRELYSLDNDPSETREVSAEHPDVVARLTERMQKWRLSVHARSPSPPLLTSMQQLYFADHFSARPLGDDSIGSASERWHFSEDWIADDGILQRAEDGNDTTRIFLRDVAFKDAVIRFDFQLQESKDVRLVTGSSGSYNAVIHIRPDHFYIQSAADPSGPYFSYRHGECAYEFDPGRWYTMTVEFFGDQLVAHIDHEHLAYAQHPIFDKRRTYLAIQVDPSPAAFDNFQVFQAKPNRERVRNQKHIVSVDGKYPVDMSLEEQFEIRERNAHEWLYQRDVEYRKLVQHIDELDEQKKQRFPKVFQSHKEFQKQIAEQRKKLLAEDPIFKETLFATYRAERKIIDWLIEQDPQVGALPDSRRKREIERLRKQHQDAAEYLKLVAARDAAQQTLEAEYPQLFVTNDEVGENRARQRANVEKNPEFKALVQRRAEAWRARKEYLIQHDAELSKLQMQLQQAGD